LLRWPPGQPNQRGVSPQLIPRSRAAALCAVLLAGCGLPLDPEGTLDRVEGGTLRVGGIPNEPWTVPGDGGQGVEVELVRRFAQEIGAEIHWMRGPPDELLGAVEHQAVDLVIGGLVDVDPSLAHVGMSRPYLTTRLLVGAPEAMLPVDSIEGCPVIVEKGTEAEGLVLAEGGLAIPVQEVERTRGLAAVDQWLLDDLGLRDTGIWLAEHHHVMAVAPGENAFLVRLERFLADQDRLIAELLQREGRL
jgi:polar amino acid transport system substrate-binding protein